VACASSFVILFCGFLFFSDLLTSRDSAIVLWFTVSLVVFTYLVIFFFVFYDIFPYGVKVGALLHLYKLNPVVTHSA
jgi:hypothetical protein